MKVAAVMWKKKKRCGRFEFLRNQRYNVHSHAQHCEYV